MSARQNKKRKGRNVVANRERTVTTLTEDPNTPYLVPTPSEDPPSSNIMSSPFSVSSSSGANQPNVSPSAFPFSGGYGFQYNSYMPSLHTTVHPQQAQQFFQPSPAQPALPPGQRDLEILDGLKKMIKDGQHEFYRALPQPKVLASMYLGPAHGPHGLSPPQQFRDNQTMTYPDYNNDGSQPDLLAGENGSIDSAKRPSRIYTEEGASVSTNPKYRVRSPSVNSPSNVSLAPSPDISSSAADRHRPSQARQTSPIVQAPSRHFSGSNNGPASVAQQSSSNSQRLSLDMKPAADSSDLTSSDKLSTSHRSLRSLAEQSSQNQVHDQQRSGGGTNGSGDSLHRPTTSPQETTDSFDGKREPSSPDWQNRQHLRDDQRVLRDPQHPSTTASRPDLPSDVSDKDRDRERDRLWDSRGRDRDRYSDYRFRNDRPRMDLRRPPPEPRRYQSRYHYMTPSRNFNSKDELLPADGRPDLSSAPPLTVSDDRSDRIVAIDRPTRRPSTDQLASLSHHHPEDHSLRAAPSTGNGHARPPSPQDRLMSGDRPARPAVTIPMRTDDDPQRPSGTEIHPVSQAAAEDKKPLSIVSLEERGSRPPPSLQERLSQPPQSTRSGSNNATRRPSLEQRLSDAHTPATDLTRPGSSEDRLARGIAGPEHARASDERRIGSEVPGRPPSDAHEHSVLPEGRPAEAVANDQERYVKPVTSAQDRGPSRYGTLMQRSASVVRDERRPMVRKTPPPPPRGYQPDFPPRDRLDQRNGTGYRSMSGRYTDDRRSEGMDVDGTPRFNDARLLYSRPISPPPATFSPDHARGFYPPPPPLTHSPRAISDLPVALDIDRVYSQPRTRREWEYSQQQPYRREWSSTDAYWRTQPQRFERDPSALPARGNVWETRDERDRRPTFQAGSPSARPSFDTVPSRSLGSRLTDDYPGPGPGPSGPPEDRGFSRDLDRSRYHVPSGSPPSFSSRVRQRSPSPIGRRLSMSPSDDMRPPTKRAREGVPYPPGYYSPPSRDPTRRSSLMTEYTQPTPPPSSAGSYYDARRGPPPAAPPMSGSSAGQEREYMGAREGGTALDYIPLPPSYDRRSPPPPPPRFPPPQYGRGGYGRGGDLRDDRRYNMAPPPRTA